MDFTNAFNHLKNDKIMSFLIDKFKNDITLKDRYESDFSKAIASVSYTHLTLPTKRIV